MPETSRPVTAPTPVEIQRKVRSFWEGSGVIERALALHPEGTPFYFSEGPPTANGAPHVGHLMARALKDLQLRFRRMQGHRIVSPMAGWDCHGLPVELEVEKRLKLHSKKEIEAYGVERFCEECRRSTLEVAEVWEEMSARLGYWLDYRHPYFTMAPTYIESVWWSLKVLFDRGLLEKGYYVLPYCPRCETPLSSHEVAQGYRETTDPSVTVRFRREGDPETYLLVWTTTPWTLPANLLIAARADLPYVEIHTEDETRYVLAAAARERYFPHLRPIRELTGANLAGTSYEPLFPYAGPGPGRYRIVLDGMVDAKEGTGLVHIAPSFGPEDQRIGEREKVGAFDPLDSRGVFTERVPPVAGIRFKEADRRLMELLRESGAIVQESSVRHTYPFCWRCSNPLIYRAIDSWFVRTSRFTGQLLANNSTVQWVPVHMRDGRFGNFLTEAKDWALSRNRYWGTPLPIWGCQKGHWACVGSFAELLQRLGESLPSPFDPHRVTVDRLSFPCPTCQEPMRREPYTIDGWYDSGSAPFAQYHYPFEPGPFDPGRPLDYVAEGLDQTRGWFYTLLVLATGLFHRPAYRVCVVNGLALDENGQKMSKSKGNVVEPLSLLAEEGGDAIRWSILVGDYTEPVRFDIGAIRRTATRTLGTLVHVLEFYRQNAEIDHLAASLDPPHPRAVLDRWLLSRLATTAALVEEGLSGYDARSAALALQRFVDELSTWYLRRSRPRFWGETTEADRAEANATLSFTLRTVAHLLAPLAPFTAEHVFQTAQASDYASGTESVHLRSWPAGLGPADPELEAAMDHLLGVVEVGRELRQRAQVKSRVPLETFVLQSPPPASWAPLGENANWLLRDELNVREVRWASHVDAENFEDGSWVLRPAEGATMAAALSRRPSAELLSEGWVREALRRLQNRRKEMRLAYSERIRVTVYAPEELATVLRPQENRMARELLADEVKVEPIELSPEAASRWEIDGKSFAAVVTRVS